MRGFDPLKPWIFHIFEALFKYPPYGDANRSNIEIQKTVSKVIGNSKVTARF